MLKELTYDSANVMRHFRQGNRGAFTEFFKSYYSALSYYSYKITNDRESAQDIVSESFIKIWERRAMFSEINVLRSYLYTTVRNGSLNWVRKNAKTQPLPDDGRNENLYSENAAFNNVAEAEMFRILTSALDGLSPQGRKIIQLIYFEGKKTRIVAEELGVSQSTIKTQKGRALAKLKKSFKNLNLFAISTLMLVITAL